MRTTYSYESLDKHGVTEEEADEVYATGKDFDLEPSANGNDRIMVVGWTSAGRLLEIGIEYLSDGNEHIFHAIDATKHYRQLFEKDAR
jgi:uncharacterized DUF497 family protein